MENGFGLDTLMAYSALAENREVSALAKEAEGQQTQQHQAKRQKLGGLIIKFGEWVARPPRPQEAR